MNNRILLTVNGEKKLRKKLIFLKTFERPKLIKSIAEARSHGDLKENSEYSAIKEKQIFLEREINNLERLLSKAEIFDIKKIKKKSHVIFGSTVYLKRLKDKKKFKFQIVGNSEADIRYNQVSIDSPISKSLIGKKKGDHICVFTPNGKVEYIIENIQFI